MKVAVHAGQLLQPVPGGIGRYEIALLRRLPDLGVHAVAFAAGPRPRSVARRVPWVDLGPPRGSLRYELWHRLQRPRVLIEADVVHAPSLAVPPVRGRPLVVTAHDIAFRRLPEVTTRRGVTFHTRGLALARRHATLIIVPSKFTAQELEREGFETDRIAVVPFGVDQPVPRDPDEIDRAVARAHVKPPYILTVGTVEPRKDLPTLVRAVDRLRRTRPDLTLVVVGPRGWGEVTGLDRSFVQAIGAQPWSVLDALYRRADAFCLASKYEGFGLPAVEAMARGVPTIATTGSALEEIVQGAGRLFTPGDAEACAVQIERVLDDTSLRTELVRAGLVRAAGLNWDHCAEGHVRAYSRARASGPSS
ncbi:MAG TPA: glycosyltransferase family 1 protein [Acidimicrobiia bacterium]|nr:glycosyltransferase family 1 protein [Acidimicrobiia bacterium]